jgi:exosome complex component RRP46
MINASTLALLNSAVPMRGVVCAVSVAHHLPPWSTEADLVLDPTEDQLRSSRASGCFAFLVASNSTSAQNSIGDEDVTEVWSSWQSMTSFDESELLAAKSLAKVGAKAVWMKMKESLALMESSSCDVEDQNEGTKGHDEDDDEAKMEI